ncbi:MAG: hypothetical protein ACXACR_14630 [Candidatus Hodarchaeales archaeon]|jgi:hypothetical protein
MSRKTGYTTSDLKFVSSGLCPNCEECKNNFGYDSMAKFNQDIGNGDIFDEGSFSWNSCDDCNTSLGGNSYYAHGIDENEELIHFKICYDCLMEFHGYTLEEI